MKDEKGSHEDDRISSISMRKQIGIEEKDTSSKASFKRFMDSKKKAFKFNKKTLFKTIPIIPWMKNYNFKADLLPEIMVGFVVAVMHIPQGMAYALLAGLGSYPVVGLYTAIFPVFIYLFLCPSPHVSLGTNPLTSILVSNVLANILPTDTVIDSSIPADTTQVEIVAAMSFCSGIWLLLFFLLRLGKYSWLLSEVLVSGYTTAAAFHVFSSQLKGLFGLEDYMARSHDGIPKMLFIFIDFFKNITHVNVAALILSLCAVALQVVNNEFIKPKVAKFCKFPIPIQAIVVVIGAGVSYGMDLFGNYEVAIIQDIPSGLPLPSFPRFVVMKRIIFDSLVMAIVGFCITLSMGKIFATKYKYSIDGSQEILAECLANFFGSIFSCLPAGASMSRSMVQVGAGCKSQLTSVFSIIFLLLFIFFAGPLFKFLPKAILASIIVVALKGMFLQIHDFKKFYKKSKVDGLIWMSSFILTLLFDIDYGLYGSIGITLLILINRHAEPSVVELGQRRVMIGTQREEEDVWVELDKCSEARRLEDVRVFRIVGIVDYTNYEVALRALKKMESALAIARNDEEEGYSAVVLDLSCTPQIDQIAVKYLKTWLDALPHRHFLLAVPGSQTDRMLLRCGVKDAQMFSSFGEVTRSLSRQKEIAAGEKNLAQYLNDAYVENEGGVKSQL